MNVANAIFSASRGN